MIYVKNLLNNNESDKFLNEKKLQPWEQTISSGKLNIMLYNKNNN